MSVAHCKNRHTFRWFGGKGASVPRECPKCGDDNVKGGDVYKKVRVSVIKTTIAGGLPGKVYLGEEVNGKVFIHRSYYPVQRDLVGVGDAVALPVKNNGIVWISVSDWLKFLNTYR